MQNKRAIVVTGIIITLFIFHSCPKNNSITTVFPGDKWDVSTPERQQVDPDKLEESLQTLKSFCGEDGIEEVLIIRNGYIIWQGDSVHNVHNVWSTTKSFTSTVLGLLVVQGNCSLSDHASGWEPLLDTIGYRNITLKHFTTMTSGYDAVGGSRWNEESEDWSWTPYVPGEPLFQPGHRFCYWDEAMMMFGRVLTRIVGKSLKEVFMEKIGIRIGMGEIIWGTEGEVNGIAINNGCTGIELNALQLARFGWLFLNEGNWNGEQLISREWVREATSVQVPDTLLTADTDRKSTDGSGAYGYNWWINGGNAAMPDSPEGLYYTSGFNNNMCFVIPEWKMVIVRMGLDGNPEIPKHRAYNEFFRVLKESILIE
jgi:CubicO group peptidase (beta-lactamase class C family)